MRKYVVVIEPGTDDERVVASFGTYSEALKSSITSFKLNEVGVMMQLEDGSLTTEF